MSLYRSNGPVFLNEIPEKDQREQLSLCIPPCVLQSLSMSIYHKREPRIIFNGSTWDLPKFSDRYCRSGQTVQTKIRLLLEEQSDQSLHCLLFHLHLLGEIP